MATITPTPVGIDVLGDRLSDKLDGRWAEGWNYCYETEINLTADTNEIIIAVNSASAGYWDYDNNVFVKGNTGTDNDGYDYTNNPCGLIFGFAIPAATFDNESFDVYGDMAVYVDFDVKQDTVTYEPIYEKTIKDTLVSVGLNAGNGGYDMGNWHTYVEIDIEQAKEGYSIEIAQSASGKYGFEGIGYYYNVKVEGNRLIVSFDDKLVSSSYGAYIVNDPSEFPGSAPSHPGSGSSYAFDIPKGYGSTVYMYFHLESLTWDDGKTFKEWKEIGRFTSQIAADVTALTVELWIGDELIGSQDITNELVFAASFADLEDGEHTVVVKGVANGVAFEETNTVIIVGNSSEKITFTVSSKLADIDIKE